MKSMSTRSEQEIFTDLENLCSSPGYIHAIAYFYFRDHFIHYEKEVTTKDIERSNSREKLTTSEISTLIGLLIKKKINYELPNLEMMQQYLGRAEILLKEMHNSIFEPQFDFKNLKNEGLNALAKGKVLREPIFYGGESAYNFQYRELSPKKYAKDDEWIRENKGFSIKEARNVVYVIEKMQTQKLTNTLNELKRTSPDKLTILPGFTFTTQEIANHSGIKISVIQNVLSAFAIPEGEMNQDFHTLDDFNIFSASPLIPVGDDTFIILNIYSLCEALYEGPFYWMCKDKKYINTAAQHRGQFTEEFCKERLELVFGKNNVYQNINIFEEENKKLGEIDVLVIFGNRAVVVQAKSKRMTLQARKGHDDQIQEDFKKSVQDSYDQALKCTKLLTRREHRFVDEASKEIILPSNLKEIFIFCVVSDHYPALSFQTHHFLEYEKTSQIYPPFVMDMFALDTMTEMLDSPLQLLSYINRRVNYFDKVLAPDELTILSYHLTNNLWVDSQTDILLLEAGISKNLDLAMSARREGTPGKKTPDGILTYFSAPPLGRIVKEVEARQEPVAIDLGFMLLTLSRQNVADINKRIERISSLARGDGKERGVTMNLKEGSMGLTVLCSNNPLAIARSKLEAHCEIRKYEQRANSWFGICIHPKDASLRFAGGCEYKWEQNSEMDIKASHLRSLNERASLLKQKRKIGRNDPCICGSGQKYKRCCGRQN